MSAKDLFQALQATDLRSWVLGKSEICNLASGLRSFRHEDILSRAHVLSRLLCEILANMHIPLVSDRDEPLLADVDTT